MLSATGILTASPTGFLASFSRFSGVCCACRLAAAKSRTPNNPWRLWTLHADTNSVAFRLSTSRIIRGLVISEPHFEKSMTTLVGQVRKADDGQSPQASEATRASRELRRSQRFD